MVVMGLREVCVKVKALVWLGVKTEQFEAMTRLYKDVMGLEVYQEDEASVRFRLADGTPVHVYGPRDEDHDFFGSGPVVGFLVDDVAGARAEMEASGIEFIGEIQRSNTHAWNHFRGPDGNIYELIEER